MELLHGPEYETIFSYVNPHQKDPFPEDGQTDSSFNTNPVSSANTQVPMRKARDQHGSYGTRAAREEEAQRYGLPLPKALLSPAATPD